MHRAGLHPERGEMGGMEGRVEPGPVIVKAPRTTPNGPARPTVPIGTSSSCPTSLEGAGIDFPREACTGEGLSRMIFMVPS